MPEPTFDYDDHDATGFARLVAAGHTSAGQLLEIALERTGRVKPRLNAVVLLAEGAARRLIDRGLPEGPLRGVPFLLKDLGPEARDFPSHEGSRLMANSTWPLDRALYERLARAGS